MIPYTILESNVVWPCVYIKPNGICQGVLLKYHEPFKFNTPNIIKLNNNLSIHNTMAEIKRCQVQDYKTYSYSVNIKKQVLLSICE